MIYAKLAVQATVMASDFSAKARRRGGKARKFPQ
jgi:hypothetical protein